MSENELFSNSQHGFRKHLSTQTALTQITDQLYNNIDKNKISLLALCDLSKAFDSVSHTILLRKMKDLFIDDFWFSNYLSNRTQSVKIDTCISTKKNVTYGVPQGSVLGPILFNIFINDLQNVVNNCLLVQFADDAQLLHSGSIKRIDVLVSQMEATMAQINDYFSHNGLKLNSGKTQFLFVASQQYIDRIPDDLVIRMGSSSLKASHSVKNLGLVIDRYLSFDSHIEQICTKANGLLFFINRNKALFDNETRKIVVESLVLSLFSYCSVIWGGGNKCLLDKVQRTQNFAAKIAVGNGRKFDRATPFIQKLNWLKINEQIKYDTTMFMFKLCHGHIPNWVMKLEVVGNSHLRNTRQTSHLVVRRTRTKLADRALSVKGPVLWNDLPNYIKTITSMPVFKKELKKFIQD